MNVKEAAALLNLTPSTIYDWIKRDDLIVLEYEASGFAGGKYYIDFSNIQRTLLKYNKRIPTIQELQQGTIRIRDLMWWLKVEYSAVLSWISNNDLDVITLPYENNQKQKRYIIPRSWIEQKWGVEYGTRILTIKDVAAQSNFPENEIYKMLLSEELEGFQLVNRKHSSWRIPIASLEKGVLEKKREKQNRMSIIEAANLLGTSTTLIYVWIRNGVFEVEKDEAEDLSISFEEIQNGFIKYNKNRRIPSLEELRSGILKVPDIKQWLKIEQHSPWVSVAIHNGSFPGIVLPSGEKRYYFIIPKVWVDTLWKVPYGTELLTVKEIAERSGLSEKRINHRLLGGEISEAFKLLDTEGPSPWRVPAILADQITRKREN